MSDLNARAAVLHFFHIPRIPQSLEIRVLRKKTGRTVGVISPSPADFRIIPLVSESHSTAYIDSRKRDN
jgi:hypothetical protein